MAVDLVNLKTLASSISTKSPAVRKYALAQVAATTDQEARLKRIEAELASLPATMNSLNDIVNAVKGLRA